MTLRADVPKCEDDKFNPGVDFCSQWCNTPSRWGCDVATFPGTDSRNTDNKDYTCDCDGCNGCGDECTVGAHA